MLTTSLLIGVVAALIALAVSAYFLPPAQLGPERSAVEDTPSMDTLMWSPGWPHDAPAHFLSLDEAHQTMQRHRGCRRGDCARKDAAWMTLVDAGHIKPRTEEW
jgi:hypothetical protein